MNAKLTITIRCLILSTHRYGIIFGMVAALNCLGLVSCGSKSGHRTSFDQIKLVTDRVSMDADFSCRPTDPSRSEDYIWISPEVGKSTKTLRVARYSALGKSGYQHRELILLSNVVVSKTAVGVDFKIGPDTWGSFDTQYDFSSETTLLSLDETTMLGRVRVKGYAGNLSVVCTRVD